MTHTIIVGLPLALGLGLALIAGRRDWAPPLWVALAVGAVLRVVIMAFAAVDTFQPWDFNYHFLLTADHVRTGRDPILNADETGWHFLPPMAYVLAAQRELGVLLGVPWTVVGRVVPMVADLVLIALVGRMASEKQAQRRFQYACVPVAVMVSTLHAQITPVALMFCAAALLALRSRRAAMAGVWLGMATAVGNWSIILLPVLILGLPGLRARLTATGWAVALPGAWLLTAPLVLDSTFADLPAMARGALATRPLVGEWGWTVIVTGGDLVDDRFLARIGSIVLLAGVAAAYYWWRRADPVDVTTAVLLVFLLLTYRFGSQYLMWAVPFLVARPTRGTWPMLVLTSVWAAAGYLSLSRLDELSWWYAHAWWALASLLVIPFVARALPWARRVRTDDPATATPPQAATTSAKA
jgi:hypothetical protein